MLNYGQIYPKKKIPQKTQKSFDKIYNRTYDLKKEYNSEENIEFYKYKYGEKEDIIKEINYIYDKIDKHEKNNENFINFITEDYNDIPVPTTARVVNLQQAIPVNGGGKKNKKVTKKSMRKKQRKKITNKRYNSKKLKRNKIVKTRKHRN
jgi:adenylate cyclase